MTKQTNISRTAQKTWMVQVIYPDGTFEDRYIKAVDAAEAVEMIKADTPITLRRWARFVA